MNVDGRNIERIQRTVSESRKAFESITYPRIDITELSVGEAAERLLEKLKYRLEH